MNRIRDGHKNGVGAGAAGIVMALILALGLLAGCSNGQFSNPFAEKFVPTPVPADFAIVIDRNTDTYFARVHVQQVIRASDLTSRTTYSTLSDYRNTIASRDITTTKLTPAQLQAMWNAVCRNHLMQNAFTWSYWYSPIDRFQNNRMTMQLRANGQQQFYNQENHWDNNKLELIQLCESANLPVGQAVHPQEPPSTTQPAATRPATRP